MALLPRLTERGVDPQSFAHKREPLMDLVSRCWPLETQTQTDHLRKRVRALVSRTVPPDKKKLLNWVYHGAAFPLTRICFLEWR
jgi:hypothetical protein